MVGNLPLASGPCLKEQMNRIEHKMLFAAHVYIYMKYLACVVCQTNRTLPEIVLFATFPATSYKGMCQAPALRSAFPKWKQINQGMPDPHSASPAFALQTLFLMFYTLELLILGVVFGFEKYTLKTNRLTSCAEHYPSLQH